MERIDGKGKCQTKIIKEGSKVWIALTETNVWKEMKNKKREDTVEDKISCEDKERHK